MRLNGAVRLLKVEEGKVKKSANLSNGIYGYINNINIDSAFH